MDNNNQHIDPLQEAIQQRFKDFEFRVELNVDKILAESAVKPPIKGGNAAGSAKYYVLAGVIVTSAIVAYVLLSSHDQAPAPVVPLQIEQQIPAPAVNTTEETVPVTPAIDEPTTQEVQSVPTDVSPQQLPVTHPEPVVVKHDSVPAVKEHKEIRTANFDDYIKHKAKQSKDSLELFKHKK